jgi:Caspase domain
VARVERTRAGLFQRSAAARPAADRAAHRFRRRQRRLWRGRRCRPRSNDAGLVAEALRSIGFEVVEGADLSQTELVRTYRDFLAKIEASGPDTLAFVYFSGHALSFEDENFLLGVDARLARDNDIPIEGVRISDLLRPFADSPARAKVMIIDAARPLPFQPQGKGLARGLKAIDPPQGALIAYASAPGTVAPGRPSDYGAYATAIAEMLRAPGTDLDTAFTYIRSRTHLTTEGQQTPWQVSALGETIKLVPPEAATASVTPPPPIRQARPMRDIGPDEAYALAIEMDTLEGYTGFVQAYPGHPYTQRVWPLIRARREALAWMRPLEFNTPQSLDLSAPLSERHVCLRRRTPPAPSRVAVRAASGLRDDGVRRCADGAGRRAAGIRGCLSNQAATAAWPLWCATSGLSCEPAAAAAAWRRPWLAHLAGAWASR